MTAETNDIVLSVFKRIAEMRASVQTIVLFFLKDEKILIINCFFFLLKLMDIFVLIFQFNKNAKTNRYSENEKEI